MRTKSGECYKAWLGEKSSGFAPGLLQQSLPEQRYAYTYIVCVL